MHFEKGYLYHVYNRGNNGEKLFYTASNYYFFVDKLCSHINPFADVLAYCMMPNHFHLMISVKNENISSLTINQSIGKLLSSYARAINLQEERTGSLFQQHSKAICLNENTKLSRSWYKSMGVTKIPNWDEQLDYPLVCLDYIHQNPVKAGIVKRCEDWRWSSYREIHGLDCDIKIVNLKELINVVSL
jgi:putative transposase